MALIVLASASGSPGVTTAALALSLAWPQPTLLVEADPTGGSAILAGWFQGHPPHNRGLVNLAIAHRQGELGTALAAATIKIPDTDVQLLAGLRSHRQVPSAAALWEPLGRTLLELDDTGTDVIIDAGRLGMVGAPLPLLQAADVVLLTTRTTLPAISSARSWARSLTDDLTATGAADKLGLLLVGEGRTFSAKEVTSVLGLPVVASLAWDPVSAETFHLGRAPRKRRFDTGSLGRSIRAAVSAIHALAHAERDKPTEESA
ncbi:hypothetical protein GCM10009616_34250 [Microlunatus lacustris]